VQWVSQVMHRFVPVRFGFERSPAFQLLDDHHPLHVDVTNLCHGVGVTAGGGPAFCEDPSAAKPPMLSSRESNFKVIAIARVSVS
jgi:hypothetical protein